MGRGGTTSAIVLGRLDADRGRRDRRGPARRVGHPDSRPRARRPGGRGQPAVRRAARLDARRRGRRSAGSRATGASPTRPARSRDAADDPGPRWPPASTGSAARSGRSSSRRRSSVCSSRSPRSLRSRPSRPTDDPGPPGRARPQAARPPDRRRRSRATTTFRFHHILIRDAAYAGQLKRARPALHERFVDMGGRDQRGAAPRARVRGDPRLPPRAGAPLPRPSSGRSTSTAMELGVRAAERLAAAGRRAFARGRHAGDGQPAAAGRRASCRRARVAPGRLLIEAGEAMTRTGDLADRGRGPRAGPAARRRPAETRRSKPRRRLGLIYLHYLTEADEPEARSSPRSRRRSRSSRPPATSAGCRGRGAS